MDVLLREGSLHWYGCVIEGGQSCVMKCIGFLGYRFEQEIRVKSWKKLVMEEWLRGGVRKDSVLCKTRWCRPATRFTNKLR